MVTLIRPVVFTLITLAGSNTWSEVYRCAGPDGTRYADKPCGDNAHEITIDSRKIGGRFDTNLPPQPPEPAKSPSSPESAPQPEENTCRFINSTNLRRYLIREQVVKGMTRDNVKDAFGPPPEVYPVPQETWIYSTDYYGMLYALTYVYFRHGCVERVVYRKP